MYILPYSMLMMIKIYLCNSFFFQITRIHAQEMSYLIKLTRRFSWWNRARVIGISKRDFNANKRVCAGVMLVTFRVLRSNNRINIVFGTLNKWFRVLVIFIVVGCGGPHSLKQKLSSLIYLLNSLILSLSHATILWMAMFFFANICQATFVQIGNLHI